MKITWDYPPSRLKGQEKKYDQFGAYCNNIGIAVMSADGIMRNGSILDILLRLRECRI